MKPFNVIVGIIQMRINGDSYENVQQRYRVGASTVTNTMSKYRELGINIQDLVKMAPNEVEELFYPRETQQRKDAPLPDFQVLYDRIHAKGSKVNLAYCWLEYKEKYPDGYQLTQFYKYYNDFVTATYGSSFAKMVVERVPGEKLYIDWVGDKPEILANQETGEITSVCIFVTTLGFSSKIYAEVFERDTLASFLRGISNALKFYDAVPRMLVPDNLPQAVANHTTDDIILRAAFQDLESFYETIVLPPPYRKPKGKGSVEAGVKYAETHIIEKLKERVYFSIEEINRDVREIVCDLNARVKSDERIPRNELFEKYDKPNMKPLSSGMFTTCEYRFFSKVPDTYHLAFDDHYYSVSYTHLRKPAILKATFDSIIICDSNNRLLAKHKRVYGKFPKYITIDEHMPPSHKFYSDLNTKDGSYYRNWAKKYGPNMYIFIDCVLKRQKHEETAYKSCLGILNLCKGVPSGVCEEIANKCIRTKNYRYDVFKKLMKEASENETESSESVMHENIRGQEAYK